MARISTLTATAINLGLLAISAIACIETYAITTKMTVLVGTGFSLGFLPIGAIFGGTYLLPWLLLLVIISSLANSIRLPLALLFLITGILGWNHGYWQYETIDYMDYDPERHIRPSGYAQLVSGGVNAGLIIWAIVLMVFRKMFQTISRKTRLLLSSNTFLLYTTLACISLLITITLIELPHRLFLNGKGVYWAGTLVVVGILLIDSLMTPRRGNHPLLFFSLLATSLVATVYMLYYLTIFHRFPSTWFGLNWLYAHRHITIIAEIILLSIPARILIRGNRKRKKGTSPRITAEPNSLV